MILALYENHKIKIPGVDRHGGMPRWDTARATSVRLTAINDAFYTMVNSKLVIFYDSNCFLISQ